MAARRRADPRVSGIRWSGTRVRSIGGEIAA
jgi:hypothetical protein